MYDNGLLLAEKGRQRLTNKEIAEKARRSVPTVTNVLNGDPNVSVDTLEAVAGALGVHLSKLWPKSEAA